MSSSAIIHDLCDRCRSIGEATCATCKSIIKKPVLAGFFGLALAGAGEDMRWSWGHVPSTDNTVPAANLSLTGNASVTIVSGGASYHIANPITGDEINMPVPDRTEISAYFRPKNG